MLREYISLKGVEMVMPGDSVYYNSGINLSCSIGREKLRFAKG